MSALWPPCVQMSGVLSQTRLPVLIRLHPFVATGEVGRLQHAAHGHFPVTRFVKPLSEKLYMACTREFSRRADSERVPSVSQAGHPVQVLQANDRIDGH